MSRRALLIVFTLIAVAAWSLVGVQIANADDGREPGDPRQMSIMGTYSTSMPGPWRGANAYAPGIAGVTIGIPTHTDDGTVGQFMDWKALHLFRIAELLKTKIENIEFDFDKSLIEGQYAEALDEVARLLLENPEVSLTLAGHTDLMGSEEYNYVLADLRADAVCNALAERGVVEDRLTMVGFGEMDPVEVVEGKLRRNRRVEVIVHIEMPIYLD